MTHMNNEETNVSRKERRSQLRREREKKLRRIRLCIILLSGVALSLIGIRILSHNQSSPTSGTQPVYGSSFTAKVPAPAQTETDTEPAATPKAYSAEEKNAETEELSETETETLSSTEKLRHILNNRDLYPAKLLEMLYKNPETLDFVLEYPEKSQLPPAETVGELPAPGTIPLLLQWDKRWGYAPYGSETIVGVSGCGPTCIAMVACGLTSDSTITPAVVANYASESGFLTSTQDTSWELMTVGCENFGIQGQTLILSENVMADTLNAGHPIICSMAPGIFTTTGHFIVLTGYENGYFTVNDPASPKRSGQTYAYSEFSDQIKNLWYFTPISTSE